MGGRRLVAGLSSSPNAIANTALPAQIRAGIIGTDNDKEHAPGFPLPSPALSLAIVSARKAGGRNFFRCKRWF